MDSFVTDYNFVSEEVIQAEITEEMSTLGDLLRYLTTAIAKSGVFCGHGSEDPCQEAGQLLSYVLGIDYDDLEDFENAVLSSRERKEIFQVLRMRIFDRMPTPYITNLAYLAGLRFYVDERVLIPRSPIAELVCGGLVPYLPADAKLGLDLCTGSGCLAILMAVRLGIEVDAVDLSEDAIDVCTYNVDLHGLTNRVVPIRSDLFDQLDPEVRYDVIVSNPPYVPEDEMADLPEEFLAEPRMALEAGADGLDLVRRILRDAPGHLQPGGYLICEVGDCMETLASAYPDVAFEWAELKNGGVGVFAVSREELEKHAGLFA